nr:hypothetical protein [Burkholderiales bacterium]
MPSIHRCISVLFLRTLICCMAVPALYAQNALAVIEPLDIDANSATSARTDGMLVIRYLFGLRGTALVQDAVGSSPGRTTQQIEDYLADSSGGVTPVLDIDDNGETDALTDGLLVFRYLLGMRGAPLIAGAVGGGAQRDTFTEIQDYLATLTSVTPEPLAGCGVVASPAATIAAPVAPGTSVQLTASCAAGQQPITFTWDGGAFTGSVRTVTPMTTTTYSMVASNGVGAAPAVNITVHVAPLSYCQPGDHIIDQPWPVSGQAKPGTNGFTTQVYSFRITVPFTFNPPLNINHLGFIRITETPGTTVTSREYTVSTIPCDFHAPPGGYLRDNLGAGNTSPDFNFTVNNPNGWLAAGAQINFQSGDVIYISIRNFNYNGGSPIPTCPINVSSCDALMDFA